MSDALAASRLPELPNAGFATKTERALSDVMMFLIRGFERDRLLLLETVIQGGRLWRKRFIKEFKFIRADADMADAVFGYFVLLAGPNPDAQKARLEQAYAQQAQHQWDFRGSTRATFDQARLALHENIQRELNKPRKTYSRH